MYDGPWEDAKDVLAWCREELGKVLKEEDGGVEVDPGRVAAMGHSAGAALALLLGGLPNPPQALLDFYGMKYLTHPHWHTPNPSFSHVPDYPPDHI
ncbi:hypothetical protein HK104_002235, partial [Borealophlyctis nickersoniae]